MAKTLDVALWGRFLVVLALARLLDILASGVGASLQEEVWDNDGHLGSQVPGVVLGIKRTNFARTGRNIGIGLVPTMKVHCLLYSLMACDHCDHPSHSDRG